MITKVWLAIVMALLSARAFAQTPQQNLDKYWAYRDRLRKDFLIVGNDDGMSIPMSTRAIGYAYPNAPAGEDGLKPSRIWFSDATIYLSYYIEVLVSELQLLQANGSPTHETEIEIYYALRALERLDESAERYLSGSFSEPEQLQGMLLRDDVPASFFMRFQNDYSHIFQRDCDFIASHSDAHPIQLWSGGDVPPGTSLDHNDGNIMSLDQITAVFTALRAVYDFVPANLTIQPTPQSSSRNLHLWAREIFVRIFDKITAPVPGSVFDGDRSLFKVVTWNGHLAKMGNELMFAAPQMCMLAHHFGHPLLGDKYTLEEMFDVRVPIMLDPDLMLEKIDQMTIETPEWMDAICANHLRDLCTTKSQNNQQVVAGTISIGSIYQLLIESQNQMLDISPMGDPCVQLNDAIFDAMSDLNIDVEGVTCDNLIAIPVRRLIKRLLFVGNLAEMADPDVFEAASACYSNVTARPINDDIAHITLELAVSSGIWNHEYISFLAERDSAYHLALIDSWFRGENLNMHYGAMGGLLGQSNFDGLVNSAPCEGPWDNPELRADPRTIPGWRSYQFLNHPGSAYTGVPAAEFRGEYSGLDYMLMYNLYHMQKVQDQVALPSYRQEASCACVNNVIELGAFSGTIYLNRKFDHYKELELHIPDYQSHSVQIVGASQVNQNNDLIICRSNAEEPTNVIVRQHSNWMLSAGNTLTIRKGNRLTFKQGSSLVVQADPKSRIIVEENATLEFVEGAFLQSHGEFEIVLKENAHLIFDASSFDFSEGSVNNRLFSLENGATLNVINSFGKGHLFISAHQNNQIQISNSQIDFYSNSHLTLLDNCVATADQSSILFFGQNAEVLSQNGSAMNVQDGSFAEFNGADAFFYHSTINLDQSDLTFRNGAHFNVYDDSEFFFSENSSLQVNDDASSWRLYASTVYVAPNAVLSPFSSETVTGNLHIEGTMDHENFELGDNAVLVLQGQSKNDQILTIESDGKLWSTNLNASISIENGNVSLANGAQITVSTHFNSSNVLYNGINGQAAGSVNLWWNNASIESCEFNRTPMYVFGEALNVLQTSFYSAASGVKAHIGGYYNFRQCEFQRCGIDAEGMSKVCSIANSVFDRSWVYDKSLVELTMVSNTFTNLWDYNSYSNVATTKAGGKLTLRCNGFFNNMTAVVGESLATINMSTRDGAGYNEFSGNESNVFLDQAFINLTAGYNAFYDYQYQNIFGVMDMPCSSGLAIDASFNVWPPITNPHGSDDLGNNLYPASGCYNEVQVVMNKPISATSCKIGRPYVKPEVLSKRNRDVMSETFSNQNIHQLRDLSFDVNNPILETSSFYQIPLDSALGIAAWNMENYDDSLGNDELAVGLFHEILTSGLDYSNNAIRRMMQWGLQNMKSSIERMFVQHELQEENNQSSFDQSVQHYVDVLNEMTETQLSDSTFQDQFRVELNKGELFHTIGKPTFARQIFIHLADCTVDSLQQVQLNGWRQLMEQEIAAHSQLIDSVALADIDLSVDTTLYPNPIASTVSDFYFGVWINSPNSLTFVNCSSSFHRRDLEVISENDLTLFPNPTSEFIHVKLGEAVSDNCSLYVVDQQGRCVFATKINAVNRQNFTVNIPSEWAQGKYTLQLVSENGLVEKGFIILR